MTVVVPGTSAPWSCSGANAGYVYGGCGSASPVVLSAANGLSFQPGDSLTVTYVSGRASQYGECPFAFCYDANGFGAFNDLFDPCCGYLPSRYIPPAEYPVGVMTLVGVFATSGGAIVGPPHRLGNGPTTLVVPAGAIQFQMGVNDDLYGDNNGSFTVQVTGKPSIKLTLTLDPTSIEPSGLQASSIFNLVTAKATLTDGSGTALVPVSFGSTVADVGKAGHAHSNPPAPPSGFVDDSGLTAVTCTTDSAGQCHLNYVVPEVSGDYNITAQAAGVSATPAVVHVKVDGLAQLGPGVGFEATGSLPQHPSNHYGTVLVAGTVAPTFGAAYIQTTHGVLGINDMSLPLGGLFDLNTNWTSASGHNLHRTGMSFDIDRLQTDGVNLVDMQELQRIANALHVTLIIEKTNLKCLHTKPLTPCLHVEVP